MLWACGGITDGMMPVCVVIEWGSVRLVSFCGGIDRDRGGLRPSHVGVDRHVGGMRGRRASINARVMR